MSGYKNTILDEPNLCSFWTFDGDQFDSVRRTLRVPEGEPLYIIDEVDMLNPASLLNADDTYLGYRMGLTSLVLHEPTDQFSISFGYYGYQAGYLGGSPIPGYPKSLIAVPHSISYAFPHNGSFTVEFLMNKHYPDRDIQSGITSPIIRKAGVFNFRFVYPVYSEAYLEITHPGGTVNILARGNFLVTGGGLGLFDRTIHVALTWNVQEVTPGTYSATARTYINGRYITDQTYTYYDTFPNTNVNSAIEIGGLSQETTYTDNRNTSSLQLDQIAIYDKSLFPITIVDHYKKAFPYDNMLIADCASNIWPFNDPEAMTFNLVASVGSFNGKYYIDRSQIWRQQQGPPAVRSASSTKFFNGGQAVIPGSISYSSVTPPCSITNDYCFEFWFSSISSKRSVLFSYQNPFRPFSGPLVQLNVKNNEFSIGSIQFSENELDPILLSLDVDPYGNNWFFNDGAWHHVLIQRQLYTVQLWIDGILHAFVDFNFRPFTTQSAGTPYLQISVMNSLPGHLDTNGNFCELAFYKFPLQEQQIKARASYNISYRIQGVVTLLGVPTKATLRFYSSFNGEFLQELESDQNTGEYIAHFLDDRNIDILVFDPDDLSVRYRAYGPISPTQFEDLPEE